MQAQTITAREQLAPEAVWIDLEKPSAEELRWVEDAYDQRLPAIDELVEIEASSRFFRDDGGLHVRTFFLHEAPQRPYNVTAGLVLNQGRLFTLSDEALVRASGSTGGRWSFGYPRLDGRKRLCALLVFQASGLVVTRSAETR